MGQMAPPNPETPCVQRMATLDGHALAAR